MFSADSLPDNPALLKALVSAQQAEIEHLKFIIAKFRRMQFGRRSEQMDETITQLELALEELECVRAEQSSDEPAEQGETTEPLAGPAPDAPAKPKRKPLPEHLPRETVEHRPAECTCPDCGGALKPLGEDERSALDLLVESLQHVGALQVFVVRSWQTVLASKSVPSGSATFIACDVIISRATAFLAHR